MFRSEIGILQVEKQAAYNSVFGLKYLNATASLKNFEFTLQPFIRYLASSHLWPLSLQDLKEQQQNKYEYTS